MDSALFEIRDIAQMRCLRGSMSYPDIAVRTLAGTDAVEEVLYVIYRLVTLRLHHQGLRIPLLIKLITTAGDIQSPFGPNQFDGGPGEARRESRLKGSGPFARVLE